MCSVNVLIVQFRFGFSTKNNSAFLRGHLLPSVLTLASVSQRYVGIFVKFGMGVLYKQSFRGNLSVMSVG